MLRVSFITEVKDATYKSASLETLLSIIAFSLFDFSLLKEVLVFLLMSKNIDSLK